MGFILRWAFAFILLAVTFNPTRYNFIRWASENWRDQMPLTALFTIVLIIAYAVYIRATFRSIGPIGMGLIIALVGALIWVLIDWGVLSLENRSLNVWLGIVLLSVVLGIGLSWSLVRRKLTGQVDIDDVDE